MSNTTNSTPVSSPIYLDNNATTAVAREVFEAMVPYLTQFYGNPSSAYRFGKQVSVAVAKAREQVAALIGADPKEVFFSSCGTESDNTALWTALQTTGKKHIVTTSVEHSAIIKQGAYLETQGCRVTWLGVDGKGRLDLKQLEDAIHDDTAIVSVMTANNETGVIFPIKEIAEISRRKGVLFHTDAVQTPGKIVLDVRKTGVDFLSLSGHKLHAPKGVGILYVKRRTKHLPFVIGGGQERGKRGGTENVASIVGLGQAAQLSLEHLKEEQGRVRGLRDKLEKGIVSSIANVTINGDTESRLPNTTNISFNGVESEALLLKLDQYNICVSAGSACTTGALEPSHVLTAMGLSADAAHSAIRFSLSRYNSDRDIEKTLEVLPTIVNQLRASAPVKSEVAA